MPDTATPGPEEAGDAPATGPTRPLAPVDAPDEPASTEILEWHAPLMVRWEKTYSIPFLLHRRVAANPRQPLIERKNEMGDAWRTMTAGQFWDEAQSIAAGFVGMGLKPGDVVAIMSRTRYEWTLLDVGAWCAGLVPVPIYQTASIEQIQHIIEDTGFSVAFAEDVSMAGLVRAAAEKAGRSVTVLSFDTEAVQAVMDAGRGISRSVVQDRASTLTTDSLATIVYTSGTTGRPKGVEITHGNFTALAVNAHAWMPEIAMSPKSRLLLFLPLAHVLARFLEVFQLTGRGVLGHTPDTKNLLPDLASFRPTYLLVVPRVLEKIYNSADASATGLKHQVFRWAARVAIDYSRALATAEGPSRQLRAERAAAERLVYRKLTTLVGGNVDYIVSGGAPLSEKLGHFYEGCGIPVLEGYGLTETVGPISVNTPRVSKIGTVGPPLPPDSVKIADDGEILIKGPNIFRGYRGMPDQTAAAFTDGWFHSGDYGTLDRDGYLRITGRLKDIIVTAGGKNVAPSTLEDDLRGHPLISQVVVVGDKRPFIAALITLDAEMLPVWLRNHGLPPLTVPEAANSTEVQASLERAVARANQHVSRAESIRKIKILTTDFTEANGMLTPSLKVKRSVVLRQFKDVIDDIYGGPIQDAGR